MKTLFLVPCSSMDVFNWLLSGTYFMLSPHGLLTSPLWKGWWSEVQISGMSAAWGFVVSFLWRLVQMVLPIHFVTSASSSHTDMAETMSSLFFHLKGWRLVLTSGPLKNLLQNFLCSLWILSGFVAVRQAVTSCASWFDSGKHARAEKELFYTWTGKRHMFSKNNDTTYVAYYVFDGVSREYFRWNEKKSEVRGVNRICFYF